MPTINHKNVAVIGAGSWGTAIVKILSEHKKSPDSKMDNLMWWIRSAEKAKYISEKHHNPDYISSIEIHPDLVQVSNNL